jgi:hypothetical protein
MALVPTLKFIGAQTHEEESEGPKRYGTYEKRELIDKNLKLESAIGRTEMRRVLERP